MLDPANGLSELRYGKGLNMAHTLIPRVPHPTYTP
jgi:hypothetical protein